MRRMWPISVQLNFPDLHVSQITDQIEKVFDLSRQFFYVLKNVIKIFSK